jgi:SAM-dependent methyltransferase
VLHIAPEPQLRRALEGADTIRYVTADLFANDVAVKLDVTEIPFDNETFDVIICNHVLEHVEDDRKALREFYRVLRPGGWALLQSCLWPNLERTREDPTITSPEDRERYFGQFDHVRVYGRDYAERLQEAGFVTRVDDYPGKLGQKLVKRYALDPLENVYFCVRPS